MSDREKQGENKDYFPFSHFLELNKTELKWVFVSMVTVEVVVIGVVVVLLQADLRLCFHFQVTAQPAGLLQGRARHTPHRLQDALGHFLQRSSPEEV